MLTLTPEAAARVRSMMPSERDRPLYLRIWRPDSSLEPGVRMGFVTAAGQDDQVGISQGVPVCLAPEVARLLDGLVLDRRASEHTALYIRPAI